MNNKGQLARYEFALLIILIGYSALITYKWATKPSEANVYQQGSKPHVEDVHMAPFSCVSEGALEKRMKDAVTNSSKANHS